MGWEQIRKKATYTVTWSALGEMPLRPPVGPTSTLSGICLLCKLVFWYRHAHYQYVDNMSLDSAYLGEIWWYTWYSSCRQLRRDEEETIKCHSTMDTDYIFWCQVAILDLW